MKRVRTMMMTLFIHARKIFSSSNNITINNWTHQTEKEMIVMQNVSKTGWKKFRKLYSGYSGHIVSYMLNIRTFNILFVFVGLVNWTDFHLKYYLRMMFYLVKIYFLMTCIPFVVLVHFVFFIHVYDYIELKQHLIAM